MIPRSARNWIAVHAVQQSSLNKNKSRMKTKTKMKNNMIALAIAALLFTGCAQRGPTILDQAAATHRSRMQEYAAMKDREKAANLERIEDARWSQFLNGMQANLEQSSRMSMMQAQTEAAQAQTRALNTTPSWQPPLGTYGNPIYVQPVPTMTTPPVPVLTGN
jgi:hypothetical protein